MTMKNKQAKQMIVDITLKGRKAIWSGDESEVFAAKDIEHVELYFGITEEFKDEYDNVVSSNWRFWWAPSLCEKECKNGRYVLKGKQAFNKHGEKVEHLEIMPLINGVYGDANDVAQILTSYN